MFHDSDAADVEFRRDFADADAWSFAQKIENPPPRFMRECCEDGVELIVG